MPLNSDKAILNLHIVEGLSLLFLLHFQFPHPSKKTKTVVNLSALKTVIAQRQGQGHTLAPAEKNGDCTLNVLVLNNFSNPDNK